MGKIDMSYNTDFLIAAMIIQLIILCHFSAQKRPDDLNNQLFLILSVLVSLDIAFEVLSTFYINFEHAGTRLGAMFTTTVFYLFQALLPFVLICYVRSLRANKILSQVRCLPPRFLRSFWSASSSGT